MKSPAAYYLMLLYITVMLKPLIPIISDAWSHEFNETEHISLIHAKYGSHHLQKELADTNSDNGKSKSQNTVKSTDEVSFHIVQPVCKFAFATNKSALQYLLFKPGKLPLVLISNQGPPPKFS